MKNAAIYFITCICLLIKINTNAWIRLQFMFVPWTQLTLNHHQITILCSFRSVSHFVFLFLHLNFVSRIDIFFILRDCVCLSMNFACFKEIPYWNRNRTAIKKKKQKRKHFKVQIITHFLFVSIVCAYQNLIAANFMCKLSFILLLTGVIYYFEVFFSVKCSDLILTLTERRKKTKKKQMSMRKIRLNQFCRL